MGGGLESRCVGRVCGADGARHHPHQVGISSYFMRKMHGQKTLKSSDVIEARNVSE